ncbi:MAG: BatA domain-containing protein [Planctomycetaceae bacterium]
MLQFFTNPWLLMGLTGIALPIIAHLLSRRRFDVVAWGAMQFLNPSRKTRRRLKLEELLLLLLRIGLITLIVLSAARPWMPGGWLMGYRSAGSRTVVLVIDGSNSMSRSDGVSSVHQTAIRRATDFLQTLGSGDTVAVIDARDQPRAVIESPLRDHRAVEQQLRALPAPAGACAIQPALEKALAILGRSSASAREILVFSDRQGNSWRSTEDAEWARFDELIKLPAVRPRVWVVDASAQLSTARRNLAVGRLEVSREITVPGFPLRLRTVVRNDSDNAVSVPVRLLLNNQPLAGELQTLSIPPRTETRVEFEHALRQEGSQLLSVEAELPDDAIAADNRSHAAVHVTRSLPVLLVNGTPSAIPAERDTFFAELAFASTDAGDPWVSARVVDAAELRPDDLQKAAAIVFCNVSRLPPAVAAALPEFVSQGGGVLVACGSQTTPETFATCFTQSGLLKPLTVLRNRQAPPQATDPVRVAPLSIQPGWLERFRSDPARSFLKTTFAEWTQIQITAAQPAASGMAAPAAPAPPAAPPTTAPVAATATATAPAPAKAIKPGQPVVLAQLTSGDPLALEVPVGDGTVIVLTTALDRSGSDLPTRSDFVPFLHEAVFRLASSRSRLNVDCGDPLLVQHSALVENSAAPQADATATKPASDSTDSTSATPPADPGKPVARPETATARSEASPEFHWTLPGGTEETTTATKEGSLWIGTFTDSLVPGIYSSTLQAPELLIERLVVNYDHTEDQFVPLSPDDTARLATNDRVRFTESLTDLTERMYGGESITELWALLLTLFLLFLVLELLLTRRAILRGYGGEALGN